MIGQKEIRSHKGDPCMFCGVPHDDVGVGECQSAPLRSVGGVSAVDSSEENRATVKIQTSEITHALNSIASNINRLEFIVETMEDKLHMVLSKPINVDCDEAFPEAKTQLGDNMYSLGYRIYMMNQKLIEIFTRLEI
jgi:hypothetical protein